MHDDLRAFRGISIGTVVGILMWTVIILVIFFIVDVASAQSNKQKCPPMMNRCQSSKETKRDSQTSTLLEFLRVDGNPIAAIALFVCVAATIYAICLFIVRKRKSKSDLFFDEQYQLALDLIAELERREREAKMTTYKPGRWR